jgi:flagellar hook-associated protein 3 FlgL
MALPQLEKVIQHGYVRTAEGDAFMRITMNTIFNGTISSGKIYRRPSDAPVALTHALNIRAAISDTEQYRRNITYGQGWVRATESAITQVHDRLLRARTLAVQGANDSQDANSRKAIAAEVKTLLEEVVALGNTKLGDRYVLAGTRTRGYTSGEAPFVLERDGTVRYNGDRGDLAVDVAAGLKQGINLNGHIALVQSGAFEALDLLYDSLMADSQADIEVALGDVDEALTYTNQQIATLGAQANTLDKKADMAGQLTLSSQERLSDIEDTDIIKAITDLNTQETSYQASLAAASKVMSLSLADYL